MKVFCMGVFDLCHLGHIKFFKEGKSWGDELVVGLIKDEAVKKQKGQERPIISYEERLQYLQAIRYIDRIIEVEDFDSTIPLMYELPDIFFKGSDQSHISEDFARKSNIRLVYYKRLDDGYSTTNLIKKIKEL